MRFSSYSRALAMATAIGAVSVSLPAFGEASVLDDASAAVDVTSAVEAPAVSEVPAVSEAPAISESTGLQATQEVTAPVRVTAHRGPTAQPVADLQFTAFPYNKARVEDVMQYPGGPDKDRGFAVRYAHLGFHGDLGVDWVEYVLTAGAVAQTDGKTAFGIENARIDLGLGVTSATEGVGYGISAGAMKIPFSRQSLNRRILLQFVDRAVVVQELDIRRDVGLLAFGQYTGEDAGWRLDLRAGAYNGRGHRAFAQDNDDGRMYVGRMQLDLFSLMGTDEGDGRALTERSRPKVSLGASMLRNDDLTRTSTGYNGDLAIKWYGLSLQAEFIKTDYRAADGGATQPAPFADEWATSGWYAQGGYYVIAERIEVVGRYDVFSVDRLVDVAPRMTFATATGGINFDLLKAKRLRTGIYYIARFEGEGVPEQANDTLGMQLSMYY